MIKTIFKMFDSTVRLLSDERQRHFRSRYVHLERNLIEAKRAFYPDYSVAKVRKAEKELEIFLDAYASELSKVEKK